MKIVFSAMGDSWDALVDPRLGRAEMFVVYNEDTEILESVENTQNAAKEHGVGLQMAKMMLDIKADVIITGNGPGEKASEVLGKSNIKIYVGAGDMSLKDAYDAYRNNTLKKL